MNSVLYFAFYNNSFEMRNPNIGPIIALNVMETELMEKVNSPYSNAFEVPIACEELPNAIPVPNELRIRNHFNRLGAIIAPEIPAIITKATVSVGFPPMSLATCMATGVVIDLGIMDKRISLGIDIISANKNKVNIPEIKPVSTPAKMGRACFIIVFLW